MKTCAGHHQTAFQALVFLVALVSSVEPGHAQSASPGAQMPSVLVDQLRRVLQANPDFGGDGGASEARRTRSRSPDSRSLRRPTR